MSKVIQKYKFVEKNIDMLRTLTKNGYVSPKLLSSYHIYKAYMSIKHPSKMERYRTVATELGSGVTIVRQSVAEMKRYIKD